MYLYINIRCERTLIVVVKRSIPAVSLLSRRANGVVRTTQYGLFLSMLLFSECVDKYALLYLVFFILYYYYLLSPSGLTSLGLHVSSLLFLPRLRRHRGLSQSSPFAAAFHSANSSSLSSSSRALYVILLTGSFFYLLSLSRRAVPRNNTIQQYQITCIQICVHGNHLLRTLCSYDTTFLNKKKFY